jgi:hypothetical protein
MCRIVDSISIRFKWLGGVSCSKGLILGRHSLKINISVEDFSQMRCCDGGI